MRESLNVFISTFSTLTLSCRNWTVTSRPPCLPRAGTRYLFRQGCELADYHTTSPPPYSSSWSSPGTSPRHFGTHHGYLLPSQERKLIKILTQVTNCNNIIDGEDEDDEGDYAAQDGNDHNDDDGAQYGGDDNDDDGAQDGDDHIEDDRAQYGDDDNDDAGDPWQQYMAAQMAVGGGYSPHMYSHRWAIASILTTSYFSTGLLTQSNMPCYCHCHQHHPSS